MTRYKPLPRNWLDAATTFLENFTTDRPQLDSEYNRAAKPTKTAVNAPRRDKRDIQVSSGERKAVAPGRKTVAATASSRD
jgi:hypothetical protein